MGNRTKLQELQGNFFWTRNQIRALKSVLSGKDDSLINYLPNDAKEQLRHLMIHLETADNIMSFTDTWEETKKTLKEKTK
jgi:hypothetical protein